MLSEHDRLLIAAAIDGPLAPPHADRVRFLLDCSCSARRLSEALRHQQNVLGQSLQHKAPTSLHPRVMAQIAASEPWATIPFVRSKLPRRWLPLGVAASVMVLAGLGVGYGVQIQKSQTLGRDQAQALPAEEDAAPLEVSPEVVSRIPRLDPPPESMSFETAPAPRSVSDKPREVYGAPFVPLARLDAVLVKLPMVVAIQDLARDDVRKQLSQEMAHGPSVRVDLFCRDSLKAAELLTATGRAAGINVIIDAAAQERMRRRMPSTWLVHTESLTPDEATAWLLRLAAADARSDEGSTSPVFRSLHFPPAGQHDAKDLKDLLGVDIMKVKPRVLNAAKPISAGTLGQISASLQKDKHAVLVTFLPVSARVSVSHSKDIKAWLDRRGDRKPTIVALTIVLRG